MLLTKNLAPCHDDRRGKGPRCQPGRLQKAVSSPSLRACRPRSMGPGLAQLPIPNRERRGLERGKSLRSAAYGLAYWITGSERKGHASRGERQENPTLLATKAAGMLPETKTMAKFIDCNTRFARRRSRNQVQEGDGKGKGPNVRRSIILPEYIQMKQTCIVFPHPRTY